MASARVSSTKLGGAAHSTGELFYGLVFVSRAQARQSLSAHRAQERIRRNSLGEFRLDAERSERGNRFFHRQADHVGERALDPRDNCCGATLGGIRAGFIERVHLREVVVDFFSVQPVETNPGNLMKTYRSNGSKMTDADRGTNLVNSSAQAAPLFFRQKYRACSFPDNPSG